MKFKTCRKCKEDFFSKNKLYIYFKAYKRKNKNINKIVFNTKIALIIFIIKITIIFINNNEIINNEQKKIEKTTYFINFECFIIKLISKKISNIKLVFRKWHFIILIMFFALREIKVIICVNLKCIISLINKKFLKEILLNVLIKKIKKISTLKKSTLLNI